MGFYFNQGDRPLSGYTIQRGVGRGAFGEVYYATSDGGKEVALKYLRNNPQIELRGVSHCLNLKSPYLVDLHDIKQNADGEHFVVMEYVSGVSLRDLMDSEPNGLGAQKAAYFLRELCRGMSYLHDRGIVHRDLKPGNIFYEDGYVKIGDYGLAKMMSTSQHSGQTMSIGTVHYMAPEIGSGNYDRTIDIYALGVILYEMLLGRVPFSGATMGEVLMKHLTAQPEVDDLPEPFPAVIRKALAKNPDDRYQTANEMMTAVLDVADISQSVASLDSLSLTRMAAAVSQKIRNGVAVPVGPAGGSSNVPGLGDEAGPRPVAVPLGDERRGVVPPPLPGKSRGDRAFQQGTPPGFDGTVTFPQRHRVTTGVLGVLLGPLGVHRFYTGFNSIGVIQIVVTFMSGGIAGLWGFVEGIRILTGFRFRDSLGRPLLEAGEEPSNAAVATAAAIGAAAVSSKSPPPAKPADHRSVVGRGVWGFFAMLTGLAAIGMTIGGFVAPPEMEKASSNLAEDYWVNGFHGLFTGASAMLGLCFFMLWKASHRGCLSGWRRTIRPALMCILLTIMGLSLVIELCFTVGIGQLTAQYVCAGAAVLFVFIWLLRGPDLPPRLGDAYWHRAWAFVFTLLTIASIGSAYGVYREWKDNHFAFERPVPATRAIVAAKLHYDRSYARMVTRKQEYSVPNLKYDHAPLALSVLGLVFVGALSESRVRLRQARKAELGERQAGVQS